MTEAAPSIVALAGSLRKGSLNGRLLRYAVEGAEAAGGVVKSCRLARSRCRSTTAIADDLRAVGRVLVQAIRAGLGRL